MKELIKRIIRKALGKSTNQNGINGKIIKSSKKTITFQRGKWYFKVKRYGDRILLDNYNDWKIIQTLKGRKGEFLKLWDKSKDKQSSHWNFGEISKGEKMLEVGFRDGYNLKYLEEKGLNVEGIDINPVSVKAAKNLDCKAFEEDIQKKTHYKDNTFNVISICDVLEHCFAPENALKESYRILKDDGRIIVEIPLENKFNRNILHGHFVLFYNKKKFENFVNSLGFYIAKYDISRLHNCLFLLKKKIKKKKF